MSLRLLSHDTSESEHLHGFEDCFSGYHQICLEKPYRLIESGNSLCEMMGYSPAELHLHCGDDYSLLVCPDDRDKYAAFLDSLAEKVQTRSLRYRMQRKDGTVFPVCDVSSSRRLEDGKLYAFSVVFDISEWPETRPFGDIISDLLPYGFLQCSREKYPHITYINQPLHDFLFIGNYSDEWEQNIKDNLFFLVPFEERDQFRHYLELADENVHPIHIDHHAFRGDGTLAHLTGWLSTVPGKNGKPEYGLLYREVQDVHVDPDSVKETSYFPVLKRSYNAIMVLNLETKIVECIHGLERSPIGSLAGLQMTFESAKQIFMNNYIYHEDKPMMEAFLAQICDPKDNWNGRTVIQVEFRLTAAGALYRFLGVAVHLDSEQVLLCCRDITQPAYLGAQDLENKTLHSLYDWMDFLSTCKEGTIGMLLLEETKEGCSLLYGSASVLHYLGLDTEESYHRSKQPTLAECLAAADMTQEEFDDLASGKSIYLWSRSAPTAYQFQLKCQLYPNGDRTLYVIWCSKEEIQPDADTGVKRIFARTFGHFDLFLDNTPINFSSAKEKELMALLIDRNGGTLTPTEAVSYLWEDEAYDERTSARYRKLAMGLKRTLAKYGIDSIIINHNGVRSIDVSAIRCDYYELLAGNVKYRRAFHNSYMTDYSWGEETLATLWNYSDEK
jgi:PAS domain S-box-containing protein